MKKLALFIYWTVNWKFYGRKLRPLLSLMDQNFIATELSAIALQVRCIHYKCIYGFFLHWLWCKILYLPCINNGWTAKRCFTTKCMNINKCMYVRVCVFRYILRCVRFVCINFPIKSHGAIIVCHFISI